METVTYNSGKYKGLTATGKDWDSACKNLKAKTKRIRDKKMALTGEEIDVLLNLLDSQVLSMDENEIQQDCEADECFGLKSFEQGDLVWKKLNHLLKKVK